MVGLVTASDSAWPVSWSSLLEWWFFSNRFSQTFLFEAPAAYEHESLLNWIFSQTQSQWKYMSIGKLLNRATRWNGRNNGEYLLIGAYENITLMTVDTEPSRSASHSWEVAFAPPFFNMDISLTPPSAKLILVFWYYNLWYASFSLVRHEGLNYRYNMECSFSLLRLDGGDFVENDTPCEWLALLK